MSDEDSKLRDDIAKVMEDYGVDFYEGNLMHRTEQRLSIVDEFQNDIVQAILADRERAVTEARIDELDQIIDLQEKQFNRWTQTDIANFFNGVGKRYRQHKAKLSTPNNTEQKEEHDTPTR